MSGRVVHLGVGEFSQCVLVLLRTGAHDLTVLSRIVSLIAPPLCVACGTDAGRAVPLCRDCRAAMAAGGGRRSRVAAIDCWTAFAYDGPAGALVRALKFGGRVALADAMAAQMAAHAPPELLAGAVVPVPVHPGHRRRRGLDHAAALARALAGRCGLPYDACLARGGDPTPQVGRGRGERLRGPVGTIALRRGATAPAAALIVDDVLTTGATIAACAAVLRDGGSSRIGALAYVRTAGR
jgi:predicted amidophosphoribosyltransferase